MKKLLPLLLVVLSTMAMANDKGGNGGVSVVCRDTNGKITSAEILDIYEGRETRRKTYVDSSIDVDSTINLNMYKLVHIPYFLSELEKELSIVKKNIVFVSEGNNVLPTNDAFPEISRRGCQFEQLANYTPGGKVLVSQEIYNQLDTLNKAALFIHEAFYSYRRTLGDKTSRKSRVFVSEIMATVSEPVLLSALFKVRETCGVEGSVDERIKDCNQTKTSWALITRVAQEKEVWLDTRTGLIWGFKISETTHYTDADKVCGKYVHGLSNINRLTWRLPSLIEFKDAYYNGSHLVLSDNSGTYWTAKNKQGYRSLYIMNNNDSFILEPFMMEMNLPQFHYTSARCVAEFN